MSEEKRTEIPGMYKVGDGVLINKDNDSLRAYKLKKEKDRKIVSIEENLNMVMDEMREIKNLLRGLVK